MVWYPPWAKPWILFMNTHTHTQLQVRTSKTTKSTGTSGQITSCLSFLLNVHWHLESIFSLGATVVTVTFTSCQLLYCHCYFEMQDMDAGIVVFLLCWYAVTSRNQGQSCLGVTQNTGINTVVAHLFSLQKYCSNQTCQTLISTLLCINYLFVKSHIALLVYFNSVSQWCLMACAAFRAVGKKQTNVNK